MCRQLEGGTIKLSISNHTLNKYDMLFRMYLDLLPLNLVYFVLENNKYFQSVGTMSISEEYFISLPWEVVPMVYIYL